MRNNRRANNLKTEKYIIPIVIFVLIFTLLYFIFSWWEDNIDNPPAGGVVSQIDNSIPLTFLTWTNVEIIDKSNKKNKVESWYFLNIWESIIVKEWDISLKIPEIAQLSLDTNWEIKYLEWEKIKLDSSSMWVVTEKDYSIDMRYLEVKIWKDSIVNLEQNDISSTVYLLKWTVEIINLAGVSTFIAPKTKIKISKEDASNWDVDMWLLKEEFDDYFPISNWYLQNISNMVDVSAIQSEDWELKDEVEDEKKENWDTSGLIKFDNIYDEWSALSSSTNISWRFDSNEVVKIIINNKEAIINTDNNTFNVLWVNTSKKVNDIIIKVFDKDENILLKNVYTLYYSSWKEKKDNSDWYTKINWEAYPVNDSDFIINVKSVKDWKTLKNWETFASENTFYWTVKNPDIEKVTVNWYTLKTYNWKIFRYHAYERFWTLWEWINNYEVKYFWKDWKVVLTKYVTINKKTKSDKKIISGEPQI
jgi:hypothetical protein